jgi:hypothetical protein
LVFFSEEILAFPVSTVASSEAGESNFLIFDRSRRARNQWPQKSAGSAKSDFYNFLSDQK